MFTHDQIGVFTRQANGAPTLTGTSASVGIDSGGEDIELYGTGFAFGSVGTTTVTFGGSAAGSIEVVGNTLVTCTTPSGTAGSTVDIVSRRASVHRGV